MLTTAARSTTRTVKHYLDTKVEIARRQVLLPNPQIYTGWQKDPSITFNPNTGIWHLYFTDCTARDHFSIGHLTTKDIFGNWTEEAPINLNDISGTGIAAPGVEYYNGKFHLLIQTDFYRPEGSIYLYTSDNGYDYKSQGVALKSIPNSLEAGIYDAAVKKINNDMYLMYSGFPYPYKDKLNREFPGIHGDIYLAKYSSSPEWNRVCPIIKHEDIPFHNAHRSPKREWGLEGCDFVQLTDGSILLMGVCFLKSGLSGHRQRIFVAHANQIEGPYRTIGMLSNPHFDWESTENGHPCVTRVGNEIVIFIQFFKNDRWQLGQLTMPEEKLLNFLTTF